MHASAHSALSREARIGLPGDSTMTGFVWSCGNWRSAIQLLRSIGTVNLDRVLASVRRHFAARQRRGR